MPLFRISVKKAAQGGGVRIEPGMSVDIPTVTSANPLHTNGGAEVNNAFIRVYGIDLKKVGLLTASFLNVQKL